MQTSPQGIAALELEEGVVLHAYRDAVGVWTIGCGLTKASGVVVPAAGMVISREEAAALLATALARNYEPAVAAAMPGASQHEFDAGVSFHFNTGAIGRASWVKSWRAKAAPDAIRAGLALWNKGGGKVLPGLVYRRAREAAMLLGGVYRTGVPAANAGSIGYARWGLSLTGAEITAVREGLRKLGYEPGLMTNVVLLTVAQNFQRDNGLAVDGIIGRATLAALQRRLDARAKTIAPAAVAAVAAAPMVSPDLADQVAGLPMAGGVVMGLAALRYASLAWGYRDVIATLVQSPMPRLAAFLRRF